MSREDNDWCSRFVAGDESLLTRTLRVQQSALMSTLALREDPSVSTCLIMRLIAIYFQWCSPKLFEPMNVYEKCKVFMCSLRCSDVPDELECMIKCLNEIIMNKQTARDLRVILLKEHITYLLKLASSATDASYPCLLTISTDHGLRLISSLIDLFESMVFLVNDPDIDSDTDAANGLFNPKINSQIKLVTFETFIFLCYIKIL